VHLLVVLKDDLWPSQMSVWSGIASLWTVGAWVTAVVVLVVLVVNSWQMMSGVLWDRSRDVVDGEVVAELRAALDVERSTSQQLTDSLREHEGRVAEMNSELTRLNEQLSAKRSLTAQLRTDMELSVVSTHITVIHCHP